ncbi:MAG: hypothetical protein SNF33_02065 [Candidatus Algichlamydia australiensis]|nr:hypothetical protein [Chlamydiales bacterium]
MKRLFQKFLFLLIPLSLFSEEGPVHRINFNNVAAGEFLHFVSRICNVNFAYNEGDLNFRVTLVSGKGSSKSDILAALSNILFQHGYQIETTGVEGYLAICRMTEEEKAFYQREKHRAKLARISQAIHGTDPSQACGFYGEDSFHTYKLQYHDGHEIQEAIKQFANDASSPELAKAIRNMQYVKSTNSLLFKGDVDTTNQLINLVKTLDIPLKQVFIEVLVIETDLNNSLDFGLEWSAKMGHGKYSGSGSSSSGVPGFSNSHASGSRSIPFGKGFDLSIIGDLIFHKGKSFLSIGSLVSALQTESDTSIILNQKILAQDNRSSRVFQGENIPFNGATTQTIGSTQQTTSNIEYKKVGVSLEIKPKLGDDDVISLDIIQDVSQASPTSISGSGVQTSEANMVTSTCVPDKCFLVVSGMARTNKVKSKSGLPCLGGLPVIGRAFSRTVTEEKKRNLLIFVRPQIIHTAQEHERVTAQQELIHNFNRKNSQLEQTLEYYEEEKPDYDDYPAVTASTS